MDIEGTVDRISTHSFALFHNAHHQKQSRANVKAVLREGFGPPGKRHTSLPLLRREASVLKLVLLREEQLRETARLLYTLDEQTSAEEKAEKVEKEKRKRMAASPDQHQHHSHHRQHQQPHHHHHHHKQASSTANNSNGDHHDDAARDKKRHADKKHKEALLMGVALSIARLRGSSVEIVEEVSAWRVGQTLVDR